MRAHVIAVCATAMLGTVLLAQPENDRSHQTAEPYLVKDINPAGSSDPGSFVGYRGVTYFRANDGVNGSELWRTDGTAEGTSLVSDINPGAAPSAPFGMTGFEGQVYLGATTANDGREVWLTDGTGAGTARLSNINPGPPDADPGLFLPLHGALIFRAQSGDGLELWSTSEGPGGTALIKDIHPGPEGSIPTFLVRLGSEAFFGADDKFTPGIGFDRELWKTDGTAAGTVRVKDINPGPAPSIPSTLTRLGSQILFQAGDAQAGIELWRTDGTEAGTVRVSDINPGPASSAPTNLGRVSDRVYFTATDAESGRELWSSDGTNEATARVRDINPGAGNSDPLYQTAFNNGLLFTADDGEHGRELWFSDGTAEGTRLVKDINPGPANASPLAAVVAGRDAYFVTIKESGAGDNTVLTELWRTDGTDEGTQPVWQAPGRATGYAIAELAASGRHLYFVGPTGVDGNGQSADFEPYAIEIPGLSVPDDETDESASR